MRFVFYIRVLILSIFLTFSTCLYAQSDFKIQGTITDESNEPLTGVTLKLVPSDLYRITDLQGHFLFPAVKSGQYTLTASYVGYQTQEIKIDLNKNQEIKIQLQPSLTELEAVSVTGQTKTQQAKEQTITATVMDIKAISTQPSSLMEIMNRAAGVRIRQSGGLGNNADISVNGFQGRSVRYFKDGIPLNYLGDGYNISNLPLNMLERVEVYKGVLPVSLGADALGGAVNLVPNHSSVPTLNVSYEVGSFHTHIVSVVGHYSNKKNTWFAGGEGFFNYSKNDYDAEVRVPDPVTRNPSWQTVRLFHNGYKSYYAEAYAGVKNQKWADELKFSVAAFGVNRQQQHPTMMNTPYGAILLNQKSVIPTLRYKKSFADGRVKIDQFFAYNVINRNRVDTARGSYDWYGNFTPNPYKIGESPQPANSDVDFKTLTSRTNISYQPTDRHKLEANLAVTNVERVGSDPFGLKFLNTDIDVLSVPASYRKIVGGLGWEYKILNDKLTNNLIAKIFSYQGKGANGYQASNTSMNDILHTKDFSWGLANGVRYKINEKHLVRVSAEYTNRLPDQEELFGDSDTRVPNFDLKPERSLNLNLNYRVQKKIYTIEAGAFYRKTKDLILLIPVQPPYAQYQNLDNVRGYGFDIDASVNIWKYFIINTNATWQNNRMKDIETPLDKWKEDARLRNTPYFFANLGWTARFNDLIRPGNHLKVYLHYNFIREFYLDFIPKRMEPDGFLGIWGKSELDITQIVPNQHLLSAGAHYTMGKLPFHIGFEVKNIANAKLYDFYRVQRAGRSYHLKVNYLFKSKRS